MSRETHWGWPSSIVVALRTRVCSRPNGMVGTVSFTIGYDVPWRQVHALLLLGASRTRGVRKEPPPWVLQRELSDFYVQYHLMAHLEEGSERHAILSELQAQIYYDRNERRVSGQFEEDRNIYDADLQHRFSIGERNTIIWGLNYRLTTDQTGNSGTFQFSPQDSSMQLALARADALIRRAAFAPAAPAGTRVDVIRLDLPAGGF